MHKSGISLEKLNKIAFLRVLKTIVFKYYIDKLKRNHPKGWFFVLIRCETELPLCHSGYETDERGSLG